MRVDDAGARTWVLAAVAGWAVLAWLLAVFGMGGRITPLPDDPGLVKPVPALPAVSANRLGPIGQYAEIGARPLFAVDRRPKPFSLQGDDEGAKESQEFDYLLTSVLITPRLQLAILQSPDGSKSVRVRLGDAPESHPAWRLSALNARSAIFEGPSGQRTIDLRVFDGTGGEPPTAVAREGELPINLPTTATSPTSPGMQPGTTAKPAQPSTGARAPTNAATTTNTPRPVPEASGNTPPMTEQAQMEAIRQRIQARRAQLRQQSQPTQPPANGQ
jgi:general secretion pathway protein N